MKKLSAVREDSERDQERRYVPIRMKDGKIRCSCGRELVKMDEGTYRCEAGWPMYRFEQGDIIKDKWGNLLMREQAH